MRSRSFRGATRGALARLARASGRSTSGRDGNWRGTLEVQLGELERCIGDWVSEPNRSDALKEVRRTHPRLISLCDEFQRGGRVLLRQATQVARLSALGSAMGGAAHRELQSAVASLVEAAQRQLDLEAKLREEIGHDVGGEA